MKATENNPKDFERIGDDQRDSKRIHKNVIESKRREFDNITEFGILLGASKELPYISLEFHRKLALHYKTTMKML